MTAFLVLRRDSVRILRVQKVRASANGRTYIKCQRGIQGTLKILHTIRLIPRGANNG